MWLYFLQVLFFFAKLHMYKIFALFFAKSIKTFYSSKIYIFWKVSLRKDFMRQLIKSHSTCLIYIWLYIRMIKTAFKNSDSLAPPRTTKSKPSGLELKSLSCHSFSLFFNRWFWCLSNITLLVRQKCTQGFIRFIVFISHYNIKKTVFKMLQSHYQGC